LRRTCSGGGGSSSRRSSSLTLSVTSDAYNSFGSFARPESSSIQRQVLPQQQDSVISVRGHTWIDKDSNARKSSGASTAGNLQDQKYWNKKVQQ
jgi:hypothetical protein